MSLTVVYRSPAKKPSSVNKDNVAGGDGGGYDGDMDKRLTVLETMLPTLATKADIGDTKAAIGDTKVAIESVKAEIHKSSGETHKWMIATVIGLFLGFGGLFLAMSNALKPSASTGQQQPIIINVPQPAAAPPAPAPNK